MVHKLPVSRNGEHQFAAYREDENEEGAKVTFYDSERRRINNFWAVPSNSEVLALESQFGDFKKLNLGGIYSYQLGDETGEDAGLKPEFYANN